MKRIATFALMFVVPVTARAEIKTPETVAQDVLDKGSALRHTRRGGDGRDLHRGRPALWIDKDSSTGEIKVSVKKDRAEIESLYRDLFKDAKEKTTSKNTVEFARFVGPMMVIQGVFQPNIDKDGKFPFVQTRVKEGEKWLIKTLQLYVIATNDPR